MKTILDFEDKPKEKGSWKPVLITNGVLFFIVVTLVILYFSADEFTFSTQFIKREGIFISMLIASICVVFINVLATLVLFFSSDNQWKKCLLMVLSGIGLFGIIYLYLANS
ncbi:hypothetical protein WAF17_06325 [Bernardetia sp. ABR2-2B]|uniref:hypothetical protein n=1 Tax=Bernardetia sp. ABR2-2B TaxID=3127472 RepID=UPI0030D0F9ED